MESLTATESDMLATYNSEVMRGIMHTQTWQRQMAVLQTRFDAMINAHNLKIQPFTYANEPSPYEPKN